MTFCFTEKSCLNKHIHLLSGDISQLKPSLLFYEAGVGNKQATRAKSEIYVLPLFEFNLLGLVSCLSSFSKRRQSVNKNLIFFSFWKILSTPHERMVHMRIIIVLAFKQKISKCGDYNAVVCNVYAEIYQKCQQW